MKNTLLIIILFSNLVYSQDYFEGIITFKTEVTASKFAPEEDQGNLEYNYGDSLKMFYNKKGNFIRKYLNTGEYGNNIQIYFGNTGELLINKKGHSKIDTLNVKTNDLKLVDKIIIKNKETIMGSVCDCIAYNTIHKEKGNIALEFCYSTDVKEIPLEGVLKHKSFFLSDYFGISKRPYLKFRFKSKDFELIFTAVKLIEKTIIENDLGKQ